MSYPYPQDRTRDKQEKGEEPYRDARQTLTESEAALQTEAEAYGEAHAHESEEERTARLEREAAESMRRVGEERAEARGRSPAGAP
jgi:hypothetical protein